MNTSTTNKPECEQFNVVTLAEYCKVDECIVQDIKSLLDKATCSENKALVSFIDKVTEASYQTGYYRGETKHHERVWAEALSKESTAMSYKFF